MQTKIRKREKLFLFYQENVRCKQHFYFGCFSLTTKKFTSHDCDNIAGGCIKGCIQVQSSLYAYEHIGAWSLISGFPNTIEQIELSKPIFSRRAEFSMANFEDKLIFITGGAAYGEAGASSEVFCYDISTD